MTIKLEDLKTVKLYRVTFEATLVKKSTVKVSNVAIDVEVENGDFKSENFEKFVLGQKVGANWTVVEAKVIKYKIKTPK